MTIQPIATAPSLLRLTSLSSDEDDLFRALLNQLSAYEATNALKLAYYEGEQRVQELGIAIPPNLAPINAVVGWPGTTVDVIEERLDWYGWTSELDDFGLSGVYADNGLGVEAGMAHLDALIYGTSFAVVGSGGDGEPTPLITTHSPRGMTGVWDARRRRLRSALAYAQTDGVTYVALYLPDETIYLSRIGYGNWSLDERDRHRLGRVPVVQFENRARHDVVGRSEISKAVRYYTDNAVRTMLGMEVHREFYQAPQRYAMGVDESAFVGTDGVARTGWETIMGRVWSIGRDEDGNVPEVGQFTPASPTPYIDQIRGLSQMLAAEAAIPATYLGFQTDNPASADAIRAMEARLIKRAERRQAAFGRAWLEVGRLALLVRDGAVPDEFGSVSVDWRDAATPTRSAAADEAVKLSAGDDPIIPRDSSVLYDRIGLTPAEQRQVASDKRRAAGRGVLTTLRQVAGGDTDAPA